MFNTEEPQLQEKEEILIGLLMEKLLVLRIKDNAVHAGLSLLLHLSKAPFLLLDKINFSQNNNLLIALELTEIKDVAEVGWTQHSNISSITVLPLKINIHMLLEIKPVQRMVEALNFQDSLMSRDVITLLMLLVEDQFQLLLMLQFGLNIKVELYQTAVLQLITVSYWLEQMINTGKLKTPGELHGVKVVSLDLPEATLVLSAATHHIQLSE